MPFTLPPLPYAKNALAPYLTAETLEYHYGKHHQAYVTNLNKLTEGKPEAKKSVEEIIIYRRRRPLQQCGPGLEPHVLLELHELKPRRRAGRRAGGGHRVRPRLVREVQGSVHERGRDAVRLRLGMACPRRWQAESRPDRQRRPADEAQSDRPAHRGRVEHAYYIDYRNAAPEIRRDVPGSPGELGFRRGELRWFVDFSRQAARERLDDGFF